MMIDKYSPLEPDYTYHIYNRANGNDRLFLSSENYRFFMEKYAYHIPPVAETFCYCLMPNHFHFLVRIRSENELKAAFPKFKTLEKLPGKSFSNFFSSYTQAFNKQNGRMGSLFMKNFKRIKVTDDTYLKTIVRYIHCNPVESNLALNCNDWPYSSYRPILNGTNSMLNSQEVIDWFDDKTNFEWFHKPSHLQ
jgi:putative transposase